MTTPPADRSPDRITPGKAVEPEKTVAQPPSTFESYMEGTASGPKNAPAPAAGAGPASAAAPMQPGQPTFQTIQAQAKNAQDGLGIVADQLNTPNLKLKRSQAHLLKNKLQDSNSSLQSAGTKIGANIPAMQTPDTPSPMGRFLAYVGHGQDILMSVQQKLKSLAASNTQINPADMMLVQIKMSQAQQEIEYSSTLLGKVIDSLKQIINIQL